MILIRGYPKYIIVDGVLLKLFALENRYKFWSKQHRRFIIWLSPEDVGGYVEYKFDFRVLLGLSDKLLTENALVIRYYLMDTYKELQENVRKA